MRIFCSGLMNVPACRAARARVWVPCTGAGPGLHGTPCREPCASPARTCAVQEVDCEQHGGCAVMRQRPSPIKHSQVLLRRRRQALRLPPLCHTLQGQQEERL
jgi:hypothetical protein